MSGLDQVIESVASGGASSSHHQPSLPTHRPKRRYDTNRQAAEYMCPECGLTIRHPSKINEHIRTHTREKPFACDICGQRFTRKRPLAVHIMRKHSNERPHACTLPGCKQAFVAVGDLNEHIRAVHYGLKRYACDAPDCIRQFSRLSYLRNHQRTAHPDLYIAELHEEQYVVVDGELPIEHEVEIEEAIILDGEQAEGEREQEEHGAQPMILDEDVDNLYYNMETNEVVRMLPGGDIVQYSLQNEEEILYVDREEDVAYEQVVNTYAEEGEFQHEAEYNCELLQGSLQITDMPESEYISVDDAGASSSQTIPEVSNAPQPLRVRVMADIRPPRQAVNERNRRIVEEENNEARASDEPSLSELEEHAKEHWREVELDASTLDLLTPNQKQRGGGGESVSNALTETAPITRRPAKNLDWVIDAIARNQDVNEASPYNRKKPVIHECKYCGKVDKYPSRIAAHERTHTKEKPYRCQICGTGFAQRTPLRLHMRRHLQQKPFECDACGQAFVSGSLLNLHIKVKHLEIKMYVCSHGCGRSFSSLKNQLHHETRCGRHLQLAQKIDVETIDEEWEALEKEPSDGEEVKVTEEYLEEEKI